MNNWNNKTVLVTGASGLIGSHLVRELLEKGAFVMAMGREIKKLEMVFEKERFCDRLTFIEGNISEEIPKDLVNVDYIFHAASPISGAEIKEKPVDTISANLNGTIECLEFLKRQKCGRLIVFSSATVYGNQINQERVVNEEDTACADALHTVNTPYSESKRMIEVLARAYSKQYCVDVVIVRIGYVYGYINPKPNTAFYEFIDKAIKGDNICLNNSGMGRRDNIHVNDVVNGILLVAERGERAESYNISSDGEQGNYKAIDEIAFMIADAVNELKSDNCIKVIVNKMDRDRNPGLRLSNTKVKELGWNLEMSFEEGIKDTIKRYIGDDI